MRFKYFLGCSVLNSSQMLLSQNLQDINKEESYDSAEKSLQKGERVQ